MRSALVVVGASLLLTGAVGGCGDATGDNTVSMTVSEAHEVFNAIGLLLDEPGSLTSIDLTQSCGGGSARIAGTLAATGGSLTVTFTGCPTGRFVLDGHVIFAGTTDGTVGNATLKGDLAITGTKSGTCHIDVAVAVTSDAEQWSGSVCGVDAKTVTS